MTRSSKLQHPSSRETSNTKISSSAIPAIWMLRIGYSLDVGAWNLEFLFRQFGLGLPDFQSRYFNRSRNANRVIDCAGARPLRQEQFPAQIDKTVVAPDPVRWNGPRRDQGCVTLGSATRINFEKSGDSPAACACGLMKLFALSSARGRLRSTKPRA